MHKSSTFKILFANRAYITPVDVRRIVQASVFVADQVLIPSSIQAHPSLAEEEKKYITTRIRELSEIGAVKFWGIEGQEPLVKKTGGVLVPRDQVEAVVPLEAYRTLYEEMIERLVQKREIFLETGNASSYDGLTEIVLGKHELWRFAVSDYLGADRILIEEPSILAMQSFFSDLTRYEKFESKIIEKLAEKLDLPDVSQLETTEIAECRKYMPNFRAKLLSETAGQYHELMVSILIEEIADAIVDEYHDHIERVARESQNHPKQLAIELIWDILGYFVLPSLAIKYANLFFDWIKGSREPSVNPLLVELRGKGRKQ